MKRFLNSSALNQRKALIFANEQTMAWQLALHVIEKPTPRVWMIFIPIFFVFYFWKLKEYEKGLKIFAENHLLSRRRTLDAAVDAEESDRPIDIQLLVSQVEELQEEARAAYAEWLTLLAGHYRLLLQARGDSYPALVHSAYRNKSNYLSFCRQLGTFENAFNIALLPTIDGETTEIDYVNKKMTEGLNTMRRQDAQEIFS
jgi:hypothetical protein